MIFATLKESTLAKNVDCLWSLCPSVVVLPSLDPSISIAKPRDGHFDSCEYPLEHFPDSDGI